MTAGNPADRLDSWKEIAAFLKRDVRTVQRWEKKEGLPVHRHQHDKLGSIYAYKPELAEWFSARRRSPQANERTGKIKLAVLPFGSLGGQRQDVYFTEGLAEEMITEITRAESSNLAIIAPATARHFDQSGRALERMKSELDVSYALAGKVRRSGSRVRITARLVRLKDQSQLWAETYERDLSDVLTVQADIARAIAGKINEALKLPRRTRVFEPKAGRVDPDAYNAYLKGRYSMHRMNPSAIGESIGDFRRAIRIDPGFPQAYAGLASAYALLAIAPFDAMRPHEAMPEAEKAARRSLELDDSLAEAHTAMALVHHHYHWNWEEAESRYRRAAELDPYHAATHLWHSWLLLALGRRDAALDEIESTMRIVQETDPHRLVAVRATRAAAFYFSREFERSVEESSRALELDPEHFMLHYILGRSHMRLGAHEKAISHFESARTGGVDMPLMDAALGLAYAVTGRPDRARRLAGKLKAAGRYVPPTYVGMLYAALGDRREALVWLEKAFEERADGLTWLNVDPMLDEMRSEPGFQYLIHRIGLA